MQNFKSRTIALGLAVLALGLVALLMWSIGKREAPGSPRAEIPWWVEEPGPTDLGAGERMGIDAPAASVTGRSEEVACAGSPIAAFRVYATEFMALDPAGRAKELGEPASVLLGLSAEERARLGLGSGATIETEVQEFGTPGFQVSVEPRASYQLIGHWTRCARSQGLDLTGELLRFFHAVTSPALEGAEVNSVELACRGLTAQVKEPADAVRVGLALLPALRGIRSADADWDVIDPVLFTAAEASRRSPALRADLLRLLEEPWLADNSDSVTFLIVLVSNSTYPEWRQPLESILFSDSSSTTRWAAIEALRILTVPDPGQPQGVTPEELCAAIPTDVLRDSYRPLRWAALELLAGWGGDVGVLRLLAELDDETCLDRAGVLNFLALSGRVDIGVCERFLVDSDLELRTGAANALASLARDDQQAYERLRDLALNDGDPQMRLSALQGLGACAHPDAVDALILATQDSAPEVQVAAVEQLGLWGEPEMLRDVALDDSRAPQARGTAFREWLKDAPDAAVPEICERMYRDGQPEIQAEGYLMKAMLALGSNDTGSIAAWEALPVPRGVLSMGGLNSSGSTDTALGEMAVDLFDGTIRGRVRLEISRQLESLRSPQVREQMARHQSLMASMPHLAANPGLNQMYEAQARILGYLDKFAPEEP